MSQGPWHVKPSEMRRTLQTLRQVGLHVRAVEVTKDGIKITVGEAGETDQENKPNKGEWD
jgi:hypothetical protein